MMFDSRLLWLAPLLFYSLLISVIPLLSPFLSLFTHPLANPIRPSPPVFTHPPTLPSIPFSHTVHVTHQAWVASSDPAVFWPTAPGLGWVEGWRCWRRLCPVVLVAGLDEPQLNFNSLNFSSNGSGSTKLGSVSLIWNCYSITWSSNCVVWNCFYTFGTLYFSKGYHVITHF